MLSKATTTRYDVAEHLRTPDEMAAYLEAYFEKSKSRSAQCGPNQRWIATASTATSAGLIPDMREAWPSDSGRMRDSFSRAS